MPDYDGLRVVDHRDHLVVEEKLVQLLDPLRGNRARQQQLSVLQHERQRDAAHDRPHRHRGERVVDNVPRRGSHPDAERRDRDAEHRGGIFEHHGDAHRVRAFFNVLPEVHLRSRRGGAHL